MQLVEPVNLLPPSICIICETQPDGEAVVDTLLNHRSGVPSVYNGRKYVCERCVGEFAKLFGFEKGTQVQEAQFERDLARRELSVVRQRVEAISKSIADTVNDPSIQHEGASFEDVFQPPATDVVREQAANRLSAIGSRDPDGPVKQVKRKARERASVPSPGLEVNEVPDTDSTVADATRERVAAEAKESDGSSRSESPA